MLFVLFFRVALGVPMLPATRVTRSRHRFSADGRELAIDHQQDSNDHQQDSNDHQQDSNDHQQDSGDHQ